MNETSVSTQEAGNMFVKQKHKPSMQFALLSAVGVMVALFNLYLVLNSVVTAVQVFETTEPASGVLKYEALADVQYHAIIAIIACVMLAGAHVVHKWGEKQHQ